MGIPASAAIYPEMQEKTTILQFDVAEDMNRFIFDKDVAYEDGMPADGSSFITRGDPRTRHVNCE